MQVNNQMANQALTSSTELKLGDIRNVQIKNRLSDTEAVINVRGKEMTAKFEGGLPSSDRAAVQVTGQSNGKMTVKEVEAGSRNGQAAVSEQSAAKAQPINNALENENAEVKKAAAILSEKGSPVTKETVAVLKDFMSNAQGTQSAKLETVTALANKGLETTKVHLNSIHEALHGKPLQDVLAGIAKEIDPDYETPILNREQAVQQNSKNSAGLADLLNKNIESLKNDPDLRKAIEAIRSEIIKNPQLSRELAGRIESAANEAEKLHTIGKERLIQVLKDAELQLRNPQAGLNSNQSSTRSQISSEANLQQLAAKAQEQMTALRHLNPELAKNIETLLKQASQLDEAGRERLLKVLEQAQNLLKQNAASSTEIDAQPKVTQPSQQLQQLLKQFQNEPDMDQALQLVSKELPNLLPSGELKEKAQQSLTEAAALNDRGRELSARDHLHRLLTDMHNELMKAEPAPGAEQDLINDFNEQLQALPIQSKNILVTHISQKLAQATHDFRELKREITVNLDNVQRVIDTLKKNAYPQAKQMLETAISKLDNAILKSEMMLFTDMKTEKQLMQASGQLAEAKKLLAKGDFSQASQIVKDVKSLVDKVMFKPSDQKIVHFVNKESVNISQSASANYMQALDQTSKMVMNQDGSARQMFELVRSLGLNHEVDAANSLVFQKSGSQQEQQQQQQNMKAALLKLAQTEGQEHAKVAQQAEQALTNITGQQLLSKADPNGNLQSLFFNLPLLLNGKQESLQVFVNSKNEGQQVDWENCSIYFLFETKKLGDVGILLNAAERKLSITIKNDMPLFKERMEPLAAIMKEKLDDIGYSVNGIQFTKMTTAPKAETLAVENHQENEDVNSQRPVFTEKGMDFKI